MARRRFSPRMRPLTPRILTKPAPTRGPVFMLAQAPFDPYSCHRPPLAGLGFLLPHCWWVVKLQPPTRKYARFCLWVANILPPTRTGDRYGHGLGPKCAAGGPKGPPVLRFAGKVRPWRDRPLSPSGTSPLFKGVSVLLPEVPKVHPLDPARAASARIQRRLPSRGRFFRALGPSYKEMPGRSRA